MSYKVLYRKYRPSFFYEVVGQEATVKILKNSIIDQKISHAYLFAGPRGTGKTSLARIFAKTINCLEPVDGEACGKCTNCVNFNNNPDIIEIDAASNNGVDEIRELINNIKLMPTSSKYKVYIIDEVHMLSQSAFNALLLTLEEPPSHVIFILATTNIENVPITILSRCQKYEFYRINDEQITSHLQKICENEQIAYDIEGLREIATLADGGLRDALSMLDQLSKEDAKIDLDLVIKELGSISVVKIKELVEALDNGDIEKIIKILDNFKKSNLNYKIVFKKLVELLSNKAVEILKNGQKKELSYHQIKQVIMELNDALNKININVNPYIILQMILLDNLNSVGNYNIKTNIKQVIEETQEQKIIEPKKEEILKEEKEIKEENTSLINETKELIINNCFAEANKDALNEIKENWNTFLKNVSAPLKGLLTDTVPVASSKKYTLLATNIPHQNNEINKEIIKLETEYKKLVGQEIKFWTLSTEEWQAEKSKYIKNIKSGYKYQIKDLTVEEKNISKLEKVANDLFDKSKIELN